MTYTEWVNQKKKKEKESEKATKTTESSVSKKSSGTKSSSYTEWVEDTRGIDLDRDVAPVITTRAKDDDDDIAPTKKWYQGYLQKSGVFDDGYQFGDITKAKNASEQDARENFASGILGIGEKVVDTLAWLAPAFNASQTVQNTGGVIWERDKNGKLVAKSAFDIDTYREQQNASAEFIKKDLYDEKKVAQKILLHDVYEKGLGTSVEGASVFGDKSDSLLQSAGQMGATALMSPVVPWWLTTGATAFGSQAEEALNEGASYEAAGVSAAISAGAEVLTERIGGIKFKGMTLGDEFVKPLTNKISNKVLKALANAGIDAVGEGAEEYITEVCNQLGSSLYKEEDAWSILTSEEAVDARIDSLVGGMVMGGAFGAVNTVIDSGKTNLTETEQKVVDKVTEDRIAEKEKTGKISEARKLKIRDEVIEDMDAGRISLDTIEEVLGGDTYKSYKDTVDAESALQIEFDELGKKETYTLADNARYNELSEQLKDTSKRDGLKKQLGQEVYQQTKNSRLINSYTESVLAKHKFEVDPKKEYKTEAEKKTIENIVNSGLLDNRVATHNFVDFLTNISKDKGIEFNLYDTESLAETVKNGNPYSINVDPSRVQGFITPDNKNIVLNIDSRNALNSVVGHEVTHSIEDATVYQELQEAVFRYARKNGDYAALVKQFKNTYANANDADFNKELTSELIGKYLFTDSTFVNNLSAEQPNIFKKVWNEVKYLWKMATAGSTEARELERVKKLFETAYREGGKTQTQGETQFSLVEDQKTIDFLENQEHITTYKAMVQIDGKLYPPMASQTYVDEEYTNKKGETKTRRVRKLKNPSVLGKWQQSDERIDIAEQTYDPKKGYSSFDLLKSNGKTTGGVAYNPYEHTSNIVLNDQFAEAYQRPELVTVEYEIPVSELTSGYKAQYAKDAVGLTDWKAGGVAQKLKNSHRDVYLTRWSKPVRVLSDAEVAQKYKEILDKEEGISVPWNVVTPSLRTELEKIGVPIDYSDIKAGSTVRTFDAFMRGEYDKKSKKPKYSLSDTAGRQITAEQSEFFKDSKMRDKDGNLMVLYHGTPHDFTVFDISRSGENYDGWSEYGKGIYLTPSQKSAQYYADNAGYGKNTNLMEVYADVRNPFNTLEAVDFDISDLAEKYELTEFDVNFFKGAGYRLIDFLKTHNEDVRSYLTEKGFDGIWDMDKRGNVAQVVAYRENQVKNTDNTNPTENPDIRYSLSDSDGKQLTTEQQEYFKDSKMRDENGNLKAMYHGSQDAGFHVFDSSMSDDGTSFFFVDRNDVAASYSGTSETYEARTINTAEDMNNFLAEIGYDHYEAVEKDGKFELLENNEHVAYSDTAQGIYEEFCWYEGVGEGDANYKVYLNLKNPLVVDAHGKNWNNISREFSQEVYDRYQSLTEAEKESLVQIASWEEYSIFRDELLSVAKAASEGKLDDYTKDLASAYEKLGGANANLYDAFTIASDNFSEESLREFAVKQMNTRDYAQKAKAEGYDGVIFNNIVDNGGYSNGDEGASTVAIAFDSNQIKSVANAKPTSDADIRYSLSDSDGRRLSMKQMEYFKDSKVTDDNGNLKVMYHGTPNGDFTVFKDGTYFTDNKEYADVYQNPGASSISSGKVVSNPKTYEVYLNIKKPFDINDAEARNIYINDYIKGGNAMGINPYLSDAEYSKINSIDWTEGEDLRDFLIDNEYDYDGLVLDEGATGGYGDDVKSRGKSYVVFSPEQVKNIDNLHPTSSPDIRYSLTEYSSDEKKAHNKAVVEYFGKTYKWSETGYVLLDGTKLDLSGKHEGAPGGYRTVDHRDIVDALGSDYGGDDYSGSLVQFMSEGNIRISPECNGINLSVKPNKAQELSLQDFISKARGEVLLDIDGTDGYTVVSVEYPRGTHSSRVLNDIREWFDNGKKPVVSDFSQFRYSLDHDGEYAPSGDWNIYGKDIRYTPDIAPAYKTKATVANNTTVAPVTDDEPIGDSNMFPDDPTLPMDDSEDRMMSLDDADAPVWMDDSSPEPTEDSSKPDDPFMERDWKDVGNRKVNAYMYENPEVKSFFQEEAQAMLGDLQNSQKGERWYNDEVYYDSGGEYGWSGTERTTTDDIAYLLDEGHYTYDQIEKGLKAIIEDNGKENNACSKRIEFLLNDRLRDGYTDIYGNEIPPNQEYLDMLTAKNVTEYSEESWNNLIAQADDIAPVVNNSAPTVDNSAPVEHPVKQTEKHKAEKPKQEEKVAKIVYGEKPQRKKLSAWQWAKEHIFSHGAVFEDLSLETGNRELQAKFDKIRRAESMAQHFIGNGKNNVSALNDVRTAVEKSGKTEAFNKYMYHKHNIDRMSLETEENRVLREGLKKKLKGYSKKQIEALAMEYIRKDTPKDMRDKIETARAYIDSLKGKNKPVFGDSVTADVSKQTVAKLEAENPEFKEYAEEIYGINKYLREMLVENGIISKETSDLWDKIYPHYVPIHRTTHDGKGIDVPLNTNRTGVNAPIKRATGGNGDIYDLFSTMAERVEQTYKAVTKNRFGVELKNTLETTIDSTDVSGLEEVLESLDQHEELLQKGGNGESATFTVFENGKRVKFEITDEMYEAMKPSQFTGTIAPLNKINNLRRNVLTTYSPTFALTNPIKDVQDILMNSQHPARTYASIPEAIRQIRTKGQWYQERMENGGDQDSYFDGQKKTFKGEKSKLSKIVGFPFEKIQSVNEVIEQVPRLAEYIASRKMGRSIDVSMLDSARVSTNFGASGDFTNMLNRNGATFLSASVEGFNQQVRNVREAKAEGLKGWAKLAGKTIAAGLPALLLNHALWDDDEEYEELSDYVKQNYYIVAKFGDGQFVRIPKGRTVSVIQNAFEQMENLITGDDEVDLQTFGQLVVNNLAPNNPLENNIIAPIGQAISNKAWYGGDLVPTRLQNLPKAEQYDETTDSISKWLGEATNTSPYKWNYILDQYSGGVGDMVLPYLTPSADGGGLGAAMRDKFTADSTLDNQYISDFYDKKDELTTNANSMYATDKDTLKSRYLNAVGSEMSKLYTEKRKIQSSDLSDEEKAYEVRELQRQIDDLAKNGLNTYNNVSFEDDYREGGEYARIGDYVFKKSDSGEWSKLSDDQLTKYEVTRKAGDASYATDGENHYRWYVPGEDSKEEPGWRKITDDQLEKQEEVTSGLGITAEEYWDNKDEYDYAYKNPENYAVSKAVGGYDTYKKYSSELYDIKADKDKNGKSISGSRKEKVIDYINNLDADYGEKIILFKSEYPADDTYNTEIVDYLNSRDDISYDEMVTILKELGMNVSSDGTVTWD